MLTHLGVTKLSDRGIGSVRPGHIPVKAYQGDSFYYPTKDGVEQVLPVVRARRGSQGPVNPQGRYVLVRDNHTTCSILDIIDQELVLTQVPMDLACQLVEETT
jgi:hypothetical protein